MQKNEECVDDIMLRLHSGMLTRLISKILTNAIEKKFGVSIELHINELHVSNYMKRGGTLFKNDKKLLEVPEEEKIYIELDATGEIAKKDIVKFM